MIQPPETSEKEKLPETLGDGSHTAERNKYEACFILQSDRGKRKLDIAVKSSETSKSESWKACYSIRRILQSVSCLPRRCFMYTASS